MTAVTTAASLKPIPRPGVLDIEAYVPGKSAAPPGVKLVKLSSNETPLGPSPKAVEAFASLAGKLELYPDGSATKLREAIGAKFGLDPARLICGSGSDELLSLITNAYLGPGDEGVYSQHGFLVYPIAIKAAGGRPVAVPEKDLTADVDAMLAAVTPRTKIVYLANPNNPTGTYLPFDEVKRLQAGLRPGAAGAGRGLRRICPAQRLRLGARAGGDLRQRRDDAHLLEDPRAREPAARVALRAGACRRRAEPHPGTVQRQRRGAGGGVAAIQDDAHVAASIAHNERWLPWLTRELEAIGLTVTPSVGNFLLLHFPAARGRTAAEADAFLTSKGLILRRMDAYGLSGALRLTIGDEAANRAVVAALAAFMKG